MRGGALGGAAQSGRDLICARPSASKSRLTVRKSSPFGQSSLRISCQPHAPKWRSKKSSRIDSPHIRESSAPALIQKIGSLYFVYSFGKTAISQNSTGLASTHTLI